MKPIGKCQRCAREFLSIGPKCDMTDPYYTQDEYGETVVCGGTIRLYPPMTDVLQTLTPEQRAAAVVYDGQMAS